MTVGFLKIFPVHRGNVFVASDGITYLLCDGSSYARSSYPSLSPIWPSGAYNSDDTNIHMPDLTDIEIRCWSSEGAFDPDVNSRIALSGVLPVGSGIGSFQDAEMITHAHVDRQATRTIAGGGGQLSTTRIITSAVETQNTSIATGGSGTIGAASSSALKLHHTKVFYYIAAT